VSQESLGWLNRNVLVGQTDRRGNAWHYKASEQGPEPNHYPGFIPVDDVNRRLFDFEAVEYPSAWLEEVSELDSILAGGNPGDNIITLDGRFYRVHIDPVRKQIVPSDDHSFVMGVFKQGYQPHQYNEWLVKNVATLLDDDLGVTSAGLLRNRAQAWVEISVSDNVETPEGVTFRPNLLAATSFDGSLATTYKRTITATVCDNTLAAALSEKGSDTVKVRHSRYSPLQISQAREALGIIYQAADDFTKQVAELCNETVTEAEWAKVLDSLVPIPPDKGSGQTKAITKREKLDELYHWDSRVNPWVGTTFGVVQAFNTFAHHGAGTRSGTEGGAAERNLLNTLNGTVDKADAKVLDVVRNVLVAA
jgi:phage/plasmid-like protein (TIGR03299 family)